MRWRFWQEEKEDDDPNRIGREVTGLLRFQTSSEAAVSSQWTSTQIAQVTLAAFAMYGARQGYKRYIRRIPNISHLKPDVYRKRSLYGYVTRVGDGDNFHLYHTPGGWLAGWGWAMGRKPQNLKRSELKDNTLHVRIAGVDAPERAHFGRPDQPFGQEAMDWLSSTIEGRYVRVWPQSPDRFQRVVSTVAVRLPWRLWRSDLGLTMIRSGWSTVYEAKTGSEFGGREEQYREAEKQAKVQKLGIWQEVGIVRKMLGHTTKFESPREYKNRMKKEESTK